MKSFKAQVKQVTKGEFSKILLVQESILMWLVTIAGLVLAFVCVFKQYFGEFPWITALVGLPWGAYAVSQACYYNKSAKENTEGGITYESMMLGLTTKDDDPPVG